MPFSIDNCPKCMFDRVRYNPDNLFEFGYDNKTVNQILVEAICSESNINKNVQHDMDECADCIVEMIMDMSNKYGTLRDIPNDECMKPLYTGYNIIPINANLIDAGYSYNDDGHHVCVKLNNSKKFYPIYLYIMKTNVFDGKGSCNFRKFDNINEYKDCIDVVFNETHNNVQIIIKSGYFGHFPNCDDEDVAELTSAVSHELQHAYDQYLFVDKSAYDETKNRILNSSQIITNDLSDYLNAQDIRYINQYAYYLDRLDAKARIKELSTFLEYVQKNHSLRVNFYEKFIASQSDKKVQKKELLYNKYPTTNSIIRSIMSNRVVSSITQADQFKNMTDNVLQNKKYMFIIGIILNVCDSIICDEHERFNQMFCSENIESVLKTGVLVKDVEFEERFFEIIKESINDIFYEYIGQIYLAIEEIIPDIFETVRYEYYSRHHQDMFDAPDVKQIYEQFYPNELFLSEDYDCRMIERKELFERLKWKYINTHNVEFEDIGCGFKSFLVEGTRYVPPMLFG